MGNRYIEVKGLHELKSGSDEFRILVERIWPRGLMKRDASVDLWIKDLGPSTELRKWFNNDIDKWEEFVSDYTFELNRRPKVVQELIKHLKEHEKVSLLYASGPEIFNPAQVLRTYLEKLLILESSGHFE